MVHPSSMLDLLKELLSPYKFSLFGYVLVVIYVVTEVVLGLFTVNLISIERDKFRCNFREENVSDNDHLTAQCFDEYDRQYNSPLPSSGFVTLNIATVVAMCLFYSCCVHSRIRRVRPTMPAVECTCLEHSTVQPSRPEEEWLPFRESTRSRQVFWFYFLHLVARLVLMILFTACLFSPNEFPTEFSCVLPTEKPRSITNSNLTNTASDCHSPFARDKTVRFRAIWSVNIVFINLLLGEIIYLLLRALKNSGFTFDNEFCVKYLISRRETTECVSPLDFRERLKQRYLQQTEKLHPSISRCEQRKLIDDMFVDPVIFTGRANDDYLRILTENNLSSTQPQEGSLISNYEELCLPNLNPAYRPKVLMVGCPGTGKSLLCNKLLRDWSKTNAFTTTKRFDFAFLFEFRWFNSAANETISLKELFHRAAYSEGVVGNHIFKHLVDNPEKILLMFDGLDEFNEWKTLTENDEAGYADDLTMEMPFFALYLKLLQRKLLPGVTILTTCRPSAVKSLSESWFNKTVELTGFSKEKVLKYVDNYCKQDEDSTVATRIKEHIIANFPLLSLCCIPFICHIVCYVLKDFINEGSPESLTRITDVYHTVLKLFILKHHPEYRNKPVRGTENLSVLVKQDLARLETLARKGIDKRLSIINSEEVVTGMMNYGLLNKWTDIKVASDECKEGFRFINKTLQEFLAARNIVKMDPGKVKEFIDSNAEDSKWHLVIQFVAGLLSCGQQSEVVNSLVYHLHDSLLSKPTKGKMALLMMKCLYEYNDDATTKSAASKLETELQRNNEYFISCDLRNCRVTPNDCAAMAYFLKYIDSLRYSVVLDDNFVGEAGFKELSTLIGTGGLSSLNLSNIQITDQDLESLIKAATFKESNLEELYVGLNESISPKALLHLCKALQRRHCKLTTLDLYGLHVSDVVLLKLCESLKHANCKLTDLMLGGSDITDESMRRLCNSLKDENCKLTGLYVNSEEITDSSLTYLSETILQSSCKISALQLTSSQVSDVGVGQVCSTLRKQNCNLTFLGLTSDQITDKAVPYVLKSIRNENFKLNHLSLVSRNISTANRTAIQELLEARPRDY